MLHTFGVQVEIRGLRFKGFRVGHQGFNVSGIRKEGQNPEEQPNRPLFYIFWCVGGD